MCCGQDFQSPGLSADSNAICGAINMDNISNILFDFSFPDSRRLTAEEQERILLMMHNAFIEICHLCGSGQARQAADLAHIFHNVPLLIGSELFSLGAFKRELTRYQDTYATNEPSGLLNILEHGSAAGRSAPAKQS
jgi:hypothetical protein